MIYTLATSRSITMPPHQVDWQWHTCTDCGGSFWRKIDERRVAPALEVSVACSACGTEHLFRYKLGYNFDGMLRMGYFVAHPSKVLNFETKKIERYQDTRAWIILQSHISSGNALEVVWTSV